MKTRAYRAKQINTLQNFRQAGGIQFLVIL
jgi:hypothetical protein